MPAVTLSVFPFDVAVAAGLSWLDAPIPQVKKRTAAIKRKRTGRLVGRVGTVFSPILGMYFRPMKVSKRDPRDATKCTSSIHQVTGTVSNHFATLGKRNGSNRVAGRGFRIDCVSRSVHSPRTVPSTAKSPLSIDLRVVVQCAFEILSEGSHGRSSPS